MDIVRVSSRSRYLYFNLTWNICIISYRFTGKHLTLKLISVGIQENDPLYATGSSAGKDLLVPMSYNDTSELTPVKSVLHVLCAIRGNCFAEFYWNFQCIFYNKYQFQSRLWSWSITQKFIVETSINRLKYAGHQIGASTLVYESNSCMWL